MTNLLPTQEQLKSALKLAKGEWQKYIIRRGYAILGGSAVHWSGRYKRSLFRLCRRLREAGIEARAFVNKGDFTFYLIMGDEWIKLFDRVEAVMSPADFIYAQLQIGKFPDEIEKSLRKLKLRQRLRSLLAKCKDALSAVGDYYGNSVRGYCDPQKAYSEALSLVEKVEKLWEEMKDFVGVFLL